MININKRLIYAFKFPDKSIYIGLTYNSVRRRSQYLNIKNNTTVSKYKTRSEWMKDSRGAYGSAHKNGWLNLCFK
jgi:hypothetical protein